MFQDAFYQNISSAKSAPLIFPTLDPISVTTPAPGHGEGKVAVMSKRGHQHLWKPSVHSTKGNLGLYWYLKRSSTHKHSWSVSDTWANVLPHTQKNKQSRIGVHNGLQQSELWFSGHLFCIMSSSGKLSEAARAEMRTWHRSRFQIKFNLFRPFPCPNSTMSEICCVLFKNPFWHWCSSFGYLLEAPFPPSCYPKKSS